MSAVQLEAECELFCFVEGDSTIFSVDIAPSQSVSKLRELIYEKRKSSILRDTTDAAYLTLWKLNVPEPVEPDEPDDSLVQRIEPKVAHLSTFAAKMSPANRISNLFPTHPLEGCLHVVVQRPLATTEFHARPTTPDNTTDPLDDTTFHHTPSKPRKDFDATISDFLNKCRSRMRELVKTAKHVPSLLPSWKLGPSADPILAKHISKLCIPTVSGGQPSLLLHDLGKAKNKLDRDRIARIPEIFSFAYHTILVNTSGSGKTRLLLEGLCRRWGFYFVAKPDMAGTGSGDLWQIMGELDDARDYKRARAKKDADPKAGAAITHMREVAEHRLAQLLLARFLLLNLLIQEAGKVRGGLQDEHRRLWVILQTQPQIFGLNFEDDIFVTLTRLLQHSSIKDLQDRIRKQYQDVVPVLSKVRNPATGTYQIPPLFCVVDEAQITTTLRNEDFVSGDFSSKRPVLREMWLSWTTALKHWQMRLVLSGTGIELQALKDTLEPSALKREKYDLKSDIGAFEDPQSQAEYIKRYVPARWTDPHWSEFLVRAWAWFHGRYRSTATLILLILEAGYLCPHRTIDAYVEAFTDFKPTDGKGWADHESPFPRDFELRTKITRLNFEKMNDMQALTLSHVIYDQILYGRYSLNSFTTNDKALFVEYGFARRIRAGDDTMLDEPLAILAALQWVNKSAKLSLFKCLQHDIERHSKRKNGFEAYLAFYLRKVFETTPELDAVFSFRSDFVLRGTTDLPWQHEKFELVTVVAMADKNKPRVSVVTPSCGPSSNVGFLATSGEEVLEWISTNCDQFTFCFPPESFGPDLLFFVRSLVSGKLLLVVVQCRKYDHVEKSVLIHGVRTVSPAWFWKSKEEKYPTAATAPFITNDSNDCHKLAALTKEVLTKIPLGLKTEGADYPVLRVFASWQGDAELERTLRRRDAQRKRKSGRKKKQTTAGQDSPIDPDLHPLATLHLVNFRQVGEQLDINWFRGDAEQKAVVHLKRAYEDVDSDESRMRKQKRARFEMRYQ